MLLAEAEFRLREDRDPGGVELAKAYLWKHKPELMAEAYGQADRFATAAVVVEGLFGDADERA